MSKGNIVGYGVFESISGDVFVGYYEKDDQELITEDNFYEQELEAAYAAIEILNSRINND